MKIPLLIFLLVFLGFDPAQAAQPIPANAAVEVGFSPAMSQKFSRTRKSALDLVLQGIGSAQQSIEVAAYSFTSKPIATALFDAHKRGVRVQVVVDGQQNTSPGRYSAARFLANQGIPVRSITRLTMHHKFIVMDGKHLQTGSFNYTFAGTHNAENALMLWNVPHLAEQYSAEWQWLWQEGEDVSPSY